MPHPERKLNRKRNYDYASNGLYFVTFITQGRTCWFGDVVDGGMVLNELGEIVKNCWFDLPNHYSNCILDEMIIMPNHFHGIIQIDNVGTGLKPVPTHAKPVTKNRDNKIKIHGLSEMIRALKSFSSRRINEKNENKFKWQRSFYDHIIRNENAYQNIKTYIKNNPKNWTEDRFSK